MIFPLARGSMRILTAVVEVATLTMVDTWQNLPLRRAVALELIGDDDAWHVLQPLEQLAKKLLGRLLVAAALHQDIQHVVVLIDGAPQVMAFTIDCEKYLIQVPLIPWLGASVPQLVGVVLPKLPTPLTDSFMGHGDAASSHCWLYRAGRFCRRSLVV